jgi:hypothetical protein
MPHLIARRHLLKTAGSVLAGGASGNNLQPSTGEVIVRKSTRALSDDSAYWLNEAYGGLIASTGLEDLRKLHYANCTGPFNRPHNVHGSIRFLYWHRAFLMEHQARLFAAVPADKRKFVTLPYWPWSESSTFRLPRHFSDQTKYPHLYRPRVMPSPNNRSDAFGVAVKLLGQAWSSSHFARGESPIFRIRLEHAHNFLHSAVGDDFGLTNSPSDPLFYCFHAEIDRIWMSWMARQGVDKSIEDSQNDELKNAVFAPSNKKLDWYGDESNLGYRYDANYTATVVNESFHLVSAEASAQNSAGQPGLSLQRGRFLFLPRGRHEIQIRLADTSVPIGSYNVVLRGRSGHLLTRGPIIVLSEGAKDSEFVVSSLDALRGLDDRYFTVSLKPRDNPASPEIGLRPSEVSIYRIRRRH